MNHDFIRENQVIDRYLMGKLPPEEAEAFADHSMHCGDCLDELERAGHFQRGLQAVAAEQADRVVVDTANDQSTAIKPMSEAKQNKSRGLSPGLRGLLVAALLLVMLLPLYLLETNRQLRADLKASVDSETALRQQIESRRFAGELPRGNVPVVYLSPQRGEGLFGGSPSTVIDISALEGPIVFLIDMGPSASSGQLNQGDGTSGIQFETAKIARLLDASGKEILQIPNLYTNANNEISISIPSTSLLPGRYRIETSALDRDVMVVVTFEIVSK